MKAHGFAVEDIAVSTGLDAKEIAAL
jgi:hypothetical protein